MMNKPHIIALYSDAPGCGKSTVARIMKDWYLYDQLAFATPVKELTMSFLGFMGHKDIANSATSGSMKETLLPIELGSSGGVVTVSGRDLMIKIGTLMGRNMISPYIWTKPMRLKIKEHFLKWSKSLFLGIVIDDMRFPEELTCLMELAIECDVELSVVKVVRPSVKAQKGPAEGHFTKLKPDYTIINDGTLEDLKGKVKEYFNHYDTLRKERQTVA